MSAEDNKLSATADPRSIANRDDFAEYLAAIRRSSGRSIREVAATANMPVTTLSGYFTGRHLPLLTQLPLFHALLRALDVTAQDELDSWTDALRRVRRAPGPRPARGPVPYKGLASFQPEDADWFFGRDELTATILAAVTARLTGPDAGPVAVVGASGSGKSSVLRAGVVPKVQTGAVAGLSRAVVLTPAEQLKRALATTVAGTAPDGGLLIVVDQFEEVFTSGVSEKERSRLLSDLVAAATGPDRQAVVIVMRADFYAHAAAEPLLVPVLQDAQVVVGPMSAAELETVIREPARRAGLSLHDDLVERLLADLAPRQGARKPYDAGALPLLSYALRATWERSRKNVLTIRDYLATGRIDGAVQQTAEVLHAELAEPDQDRARRLFLRAVNVDDEGTATRRRIRLTDLDDATRRVADRFVERRLLTAGQETVEVTHEALLTAWPRLQGWIDGDRAGLRVHRQLADAAQMWHEAAREEGALLRGGRLDAATEWAADPRHTALLDSTEREYLAASQRAVLVEQVSRRRRTRWLQQLLAVVAVLGLLAAGLAVAAYRQRATAERQRASARAERDVALSRQLATEADQLRTKDPALAADIALAAYRISPTVQARSSLLDSYAIPRPVRLIGPPGPMQAVAVSHDGRLLAAICADATVRLWSLAGRAPTELPSVSVGDAGTLFALALSQDGRLLAVAGKDRVVHVYDISTASDVRPLGPALTGAKDTVFSLAFAPNGGVLYAGSADKLVHRWRLGSASPQPLPPLTGPTGYVQALSLDAAGRVLAAGSADGTARLWNLATTGTGAPAATVTVGDATDTVFSVAVSPDGHRLATGARDGSIHLWDITRPNAPRPLGVPLAAHASWVNALAFSPDGQLLASGSSDNSVGLFEVATGQRLARFANPTAVTSVSFDPSGRNLATGSTDGVARLWPVPGPVFAGPAATIFASAFSPDSTLLALDAGSKAPAVWLWDVADPLRPRRYPTPITLPPSAGKLNGTASVSRDGTLLAVGSPTGQVWLWDISDPARPVRFPKPLDGGTLSIEATAFSPDSHLIAAASDDYSVHLWNVTNRHAITALPALTGLGNQVYALAFRPDGRYLVGTGADRNAVMWDIATPTAAKAVATIADFGSYVYTAAFSPDGDTLAVGGADMTVRLFDVRDPAHPVALGPPLTGPTDYVTSVAYSPDGRTLAVASLDGILWLWDVSTPGRPKQIGALTAAGGGVDTTIFSRDGTVLVGAGTSKQGTVWLTDPAAVAAWICSAGDGLTAQEWARYVPGVSRRSLC